MKFLTLLLVAVLGIPPYGPALEMLREDPDRSGVNTHVYEFRPEHDTPAPKGYKPFYLLHYGRHGSRNDMQDKYYKELAEGLEEALEGGFLSPDGERLLDQTRQVIEAYRDSPGHLTRRGEQEHRELARRMYARYKRIFAKGNNNIRVESSIVPRVLVSMASFTGELTRLQPDLQYTIDSDEKIFNYINNSSTKEHSKAAYRMVDSLEAGTVLDSVQIYRRLFTDPARGKRIFPDADRFQKNIWLTAKIAKACDIDGSPYEFLSEEVIYNCWARTLCSIYLRQCNSVEFGAWRREQTRPLVEVVFDRADEALTEGTVAADLLFGHDYPLLGLACWFRLDGVGDTLRLEEITDKWYDPTNIPLASNMQMVFYRSRKQDAPVLVKFVYNGRERAVGGLTPVSGPYYQWEDVADAYKP